jgi:hypothetical protein
MGTSTSRRMDDSDSRSRSDDSSDQDSDLATILQYLIQRLVVGEWRFIPWHVHVDLLKFNYISIEKLTSHSLLNMSLFKR